MTAKRTATDPAELANATPAEQATLGALLLDSARAWPEVAGLLLEEDFSRADHRAIFRAIRDTATSGTPADVLTEYHDYRADGGLTVPHARTSSVGGTVAQKVTVKSVQVNPAVPADAFGAGK